MPSQCVMPVVALVPSRPAGGPDPFILARIGVLTSEITEDLVDEVIEVTGCRERRRRRLPAVTVVYLVLGMCLLSGADGAGPPGYRPVMRSLSNGLRHLAGAALPTRQAFGRARARLGSKPLELLFDRYRGPRAAPGTPGAFAFGRRITAIDGTTLAAPLTPANLAELGTASTGSAPLVRLLALIETGTHAVIDAAFGGAGRVSEHDLARRVLHALRPGMLMLADRNFPGYELWSAAAATGADLVWRIKKNQVLTPVKTLPDGSYLAIMPTPAEARRGWRNRKAGKPPAAGRTVRVIEYTVATRTADGTRSTASFRLITTLTDHAEAPAREIAALYHERWESEGSYQELKTRLKGTGFTLRSRTPDLISQEMHAFLTVYHALCTLETTAAATAGTDPGRISFTVTLRAVRDQAVSNDIITRPGTLDQALHWVTTDMLTDLADPRRTRSCERKTSPAPGKYHTRDRTQPRPASAVTHTITITTTPDPPPAQTP